MGNLKKKKGCFYIFPNLIKIKKFQEQLIILKGDYDGHFFAQGYFGSQSLHRKKSFNFLCRNGQECNTFFTGGGGSLYLRQLGETNRQHLRDSARMRCHSPSTEHTGGLRLFSREFPESDLF